MHGEYRGEVPSCRSDLGSPSQAGTKCLHLGVTVDSSALPQDWGPQTMHMKGPPPDCAESPGHIAFPWTLPSESLTQ